MYKVLEACGYPRAGTDWLRRRRLLVVLVLAILSWLLFLLLGGMIYLVALQVIEFFAVGGFSTLR